MDIEWKNKAIPHEAEAVAAGIEEGGEKIRFAIVGDLTTAGKYAEPVLFFTDTAVYTACDTPREPKKYLYADMKDVRTKRMYGSAVLSAEMPDGKREIVFRYTYIIASLCDAAAVFVNHMRDGADIADEMETIAAVYERALCVCPKCGRPLLHPGAECIMCRSKKKTFKTLFVYIRPSVPTLLVCIALSLFTTFMALVPPAITGFIVDVVFPDGRGASSIAPLNALASML